MDRTTTGAGSLTGWVKRVEQTLDESTRLVLSSAPVITSLTAGAATWWWLDASGGSARDASLGAASLVTVIVFAFGALMALYLNRLLARFRMLRAALSTVDAALVITDERNEIVQFNGNAYRYYAERGCKLSKGMSMCELLMASATHTGVPEAERAAWVRARHERRARHIDSGEPMLLDDPSTGRHLQLSLARLPNGHVVDMRTDVTALKQKELELAERERELDAARVAAESSNRAKSEFLANMSHEIRTPMNGVVGMAELLVESGLNTQQLRYARTVSSSALSLLTLINDILDFSKVEAGKLEIDSSAFDLRAMLDDVATLLATGAQSKGVEMVLNVAPELPHHVIGDVARLRQIVTNLLGNAVKFTESGFVELQVTGDVLGDAARLSIAVRDTGIGIPLALQESVFRVFEQVDGASSRRFEGTGLGLAIATRLAALMGASIELESSPGEGSTFRFELTLPVAEAPPVETIAPVGSLAGRTLLIVDDLPLNREILSRRAEGWGMQVECCASGAEALARLDALPAGSIDIGVLDFQMPDMDGHDLCTALKGAPSTREIPLVLLSSVDASLQGDLPRSLGFAACVAKPLRAGSLRRTLLEALSDAANGGAIGLASEPASPGPGAVTPAVAPVAMRGVATDGRDAPRVLVVEDNAINQLVIGGMLETFGIEPDFANDGLEGVEAIEREHYDLVFMDLSMPRMGGLEATGEIRALETRAARAPSTILALTANAMDGDRERCLAAGMNDFLAKPLQRAPLQQALERWMAPTGLASDTLPDAA